MRIEWDRYRVCFHAIGRNRWANGLIAEPFWIKGAGLPQDDLWFVWAGQGKMRLRHGWVELRPGICLWMRKGRCYRVKQDPQNPLGMNFFNFALVDKDGHERPARAASPPEYIEPPDPQLAEAMTRRVVELCYGFDSGSFSSPPFDPEVAAVSENLFTSLLMELDAATDRTGPNREPKVPPHYDRLIRQVALRMTENSHAIPSVKELAREFGYSTGHFSKIFKEVTGQTPELYGVHTRIHRAHRLLQETALSIGEIATMLGYRDIYFFSKQFKQFTRLSPLQHRQKHRAD
jgi:AraC-like DNA-binding protein